MRLIVRFVAAGVTVIFMSLLLLVVSFNMPARLVERSERAAPPMLNDSLLPATDNSQGDPGSLLVTPLDKINDTFSRKYHVIQVSGNFKTKAVSKKRKTTKNKKILRSLKTNKLNYQKVNLLYFLQMFFGNSSPSVMGVTNVNFHLSASI